MLFWSQAHIHWMVGTHGLGEKINYHRLSLPELDGHTCLYPIKAVPTRQRRETTDNLLMPGRNRHDLLNGTGTQVQEHSNPD
jgi:hypothetical protein